MLERKERADDVYVDGGAPRLELGERERCHVLGPARARNDYVERAGGLGGPGDRRRHLFLVGDVGDDPVHRVTRGGVP